MKKLTLIIAMALGVMSCKKEQVTNVTKYEVGNYECNIPLYSVKVSNDTLYADSENCKYIYVKTSELEFTSHSIFWKYQNNMTNWAEIKKAYFQGNKLIINI